eukprot:SAG11_NODE_1295_length_5275_cov_3.069165_8_plen_79_part_00
MAGPGTRGYRVEISQYLGTTCIHGNGAVWLLNLVLNYKYYYNNTYTADPVNTANLLRPKSRHTGPTDVDRININIRTR